VGDIIPAATMRFICFAVGEGVEPSRGL